MSPSNPTLVPVDNASDPAVRTWDAGTASVAACDTVKAAYFAQRLPAGMVWENPDPTTDESVAALAAFVTTMAWPPDPADEPPASTIVRLAGFSAFGAIAACVKAGASGATAAAMYRRLTSNPDHGPADCHETLVEAATSAVWEPVLRGVLTIVAAAVGAAVMLLGLRALTQPRPN
jgi:hypothetical protein